MTNQLKIFAFYSMVLALLATIKFASFAAISSTSNAVVKCPPGWLEERGQCCRHGCVRCCSPQEIEEGVCPCSGGGQQTTTQGTNSVPCANQGEICGGFSGVECCSGQRCVFQQGADFGYCNSSNSLPCANFGEICGGFAGIRCCSGQRCVFQPNSDFGYCRRTSLPCAKERQICGGYAGIECCSGRPCEMEPMADYGYC